jgi:hypothetical protein
MLHWSPPTQKVKPKNQSRRPSLLLSAPIVRPSLPEPLDFGGADPSLPEPLDFGPLPDATPPSLPDTLLRQSSEPNLRMLSPTSIDFTVEETPIPRTKSTITIYIRLESGESNDPEQLVYDPRTMCRHRVVSEANRVGICNVFEMDEMRPAAVNWQINQLRQLYHSYKSVHQANLAYLATINSIKFRTMALEDSSSDIANIARLRHMERVPYITSKGKRLFEAHNMTKKEFNEQMVKEYYERDRGGHLRVYHVNKKWTTHDAVDDPHEADVPPTYFMGVYIIGTRHSTVDLIDKITQDELIPIPSLARASSHPEFIDKFQDIQQQNLMNVDVSKRISDKPFGQVITDKFTGIPHYTKTDLSHILKFFKDVGFDYVNIIDAGCRMVDIPMDGQYERNRAQSAKEKTDYEIAQAAVGLLPKKSRKLNKQKYKLTRRRQKRIYTQRKRRSLSPK